VGAWRRGVRRSHRRPPPLWTKDVFRLAVVPFDFPDVKHNAKVPSGVGRTAVQPRPLHEDTRNRPAGHGSLNDYYREVSSGAANRGQGLRLGGVEQEARDYVQGSGTSGKTVPLEEPSTS
jgi:hypothetical protein